MAKGVKIGVVIPTCDELRREMLAFQLQRLERQTRKSDYVALVDYPNLTGRSDITERYIKGITECFGAGCDFVLFIEDDDYYPLTYIEEMYSEWRKAGKPVLIGANCYTYYHIFEKAYKQEQLRRHSSAFTSAVAPGVSFKCTEDAMLFDIVLWQKNKGKLIRLKNNPIGIKHGIGATGGSGHTAKIYKNFDDKNQTVLRSLLDAEGFEFYSKLQPAQMMLYEWRDMLTKTKQQKRDLRVAWSLDTSYGGFPFIVNYLDCVPVVYNRRLSYFDDMVINLQSYVDDKDRVNGLLLRATDLFLFGAKGTQYLINLLKQIGRRLADYNSITYIVTDSWCYKDPVKNKDRINRELSLVKDLRVFAMPDIAGQSDIMQRYPQTRLYYQSIPQHDLPAKAKTFTVAHSPGLKATTNEKGTKQIQAVCESLKIKLNIITGLSWHQAQAIKAETTVFVDQLIIPGQCANKDMPQTWHGGLGKSGLEAMMMGCVVITSGIFADSDEMPAPPVIIANTPRKLQAALKKLKSNPAYRKQMAKLQRDWVVKFTALEFNIKRLAPDIQRVKQLYSSYTVRFFEQAMRQKYGLNPVTDTDAPVVIKGMYRNEDYLFARRHGGEKIILWCGTDVTYLERLYMHYLPIRARHIALSKDVRARLSRLGVDAELYPVTPTEIIADPQPRGECVYFYGHGDNYGEDLMDKVEKEISYTVIRATKDTFSKEDLKKAYKRCFMGLRFTPRDGLANTVVELGLMGRRCLWNCGDLPNAVKYDPGDVASIVRQIDDEYSRRGESNTELARAVAEKLTVNSDGWLYLNCKKQKQMKIIAIAFVYNELEYLPAAVEYYKQQGVEVYLIDNYSDDGTWQWIKRQKIPGHRYDTGGAFDLVALQGEMKRTLDRLQPDWFLWFAPDLFHVFSKLTIKQAIDTVNQLGYDQIKSPCYQLKNTGEDQAGFFSGVYKYGELNNMVQLISKYNENITFAADKVLLKGAKIIEGGVIFEFGACKPKYQQEVKLRRREKAWQNGLNGNSGKHYVEGHVNGWITDKSTLKNIMLTEHKQSLKKLYSYGTNIQNEKR